MFKRNKIQPRFPQTAANRAVNRMLTYGLILFIIYAVYNNGQHRTSSPTPAPDMNYTQINWRNYVKVTNLLNGRQNSYNFAENNQLTLELTASDLDKVGDKNSTPVYKLEFDQDASCNGIYSFNH